MYFSIKLDDSFQFYHLFFDNVMLDQYACSWASAYHVTQLPERIFIRYKDKIEALKLTPGCIDVYFRMFDPSMEEKMEIITEDFHNHVNRYFYKDIYFGDELEKLIFDSDGHICLLDEFLFFMLRYYATKFNLIYIETTLSVLENKEKIKNGPYSDGLKKLADACMHESEVRFEVNQPYIIAHFGNALYHCPLVCQFHAVFNQQLRFFDCEINASEVLINPDGTFQYNALVYTENYVKKEINIQFFDVEVEEMETEKECINEN